MLNRNNRIKSLSKRRFHSLNRYEQEVYETRGKVSRMMCRGCFKPKHTFETEKEANLFMYYLGDEIEAVRGFRPVRTYWCECCAGYHVTHLANWSTSDVG